MKYVFSGKFGPQRLTSVNSHLVSLDSSKPRQNHDSPLTIVRALSVAPSWLFARRWAITIPKTSHSQILTPQKVSSASLLLYHLGRRLKHPVWKDYILNRPELNRAKTKQRKGVNHLKGTISRAEKPHSKNMFLLYEQASKHSTPEVQLQPDRKHNRHWEIIEILEILFFVLFKDSWLSPMPSLFLHDLSIFQSLLKTREATAHTSWSEVIMLPSWLWSASSWILHAASSIAFMIDF